MNKDDFEQRRAHLTGLSDEQLQQKFWDTVGQVVNPLIDFAQKHTSPSVERSVLLRMGFSSIEAKEIVNHCIEKGLLGKGAGHAVWRLAKMDGLSIRDAGLRLAKGEGWLKLSEYWQRGYNNAQ